MILIIDFSLLLIELTDSSRFFQRILNQRALLTMSTHETKLDSPADWERWKRQFQSLARATDLWRVVGGLQTPLEMPDEPKFSSYPRAAATQSQTRSQSLAVEDSQSTVQQETQGPTVPTEYAHLSTAGKKDYSSA